MTFIGKKRKWKMTVKNPSMYYAKYRFFKKFKIIWYFKLPTKTTYYLAYIIKFVYELKLKKNFLHRQRIKHQYILYLHDIKVMSINYISWLYYHSMKYFKVLINNDIVITLFQSIMQIIILNIIIYTIIDLHNLRLPIVD